MAQQMLNLGGNLPPEELLKQQQILRQQQMAQMLMQQGQQVPQGQMVSGRYVAPSFTQSLAGLANVYLGKKGLEKAEQEQLKMAERLREREGQSVKEYFEAGPDYQKALQIATNPYAPSWLKSQAVEQFKPQKLGEGEVLTRINPRTGQIETIASGGEKYRAPISVDTGTTIELRDPKNPTVVLQSIPKSQMPTAGQVVERDDGTFLVDTRTGQARPVMGVGGQQLQGKPRTLPEGLNKQVTGAVNLTDAIADYQNKIKGFGFKDFANPDKRAEMGNLYNNMMLQAKEAYNLGVLNGPDYDILQRIVKDPTNVGSLAFSNTALSKQADSLRKTSSDIVKNAYLSQGREVPADISAKFVKKEEPKTEKQSAAQQLGLSKVPAGVDPKVWNVMTPEEKALFK